MALVINYLHSIYGVLPKLTVILDWNISAQEKHEACMKTLGLQCMVGIFKNVNVKNVNLFFSNSKLGSTANSLPADFLKALVHFALRGFFFLLNALWHFDLEIQDLPTSM